MRRRDNGSSTSYNSDALFERFLSLAEIEFRDPNEQTPLWPAPYAENTAEAAFRFLTECCWTLNEANGSVELIPPHDYIFRAVTEWFEGRSQGRPLIVEKSRRLIMSWVFRGLGLWRSGRRMEKGIVAGLNYPKAAEHVWRIWWLHNELQKRRPEFKLAPAIPRGGNVAAQQLDQVLLPNGSLIESLNQDGASFQGSGYSWVDMEEFSLYRHPEYMYAQALRVTEGKPGDVGGMVSIITNASASKAWQGIKSQVSGEWRKRFRHQPGRKISEGDCGNGARYLFIHYSADPSKGGGWASVERPKVPQREWDREMEGREDIYDGEPVFFDFEEDRHHPERFRGDERIPIVPGSVYVAAWDAGVTRTPAMVLYQITPPPYQVHLILEVTSSGSDPMSSFAPRVLRELQRKLPGSWPDVIHVGDGTIATKSGATNDSAQSVAFKVLGKNIQPMSNVLSVMQSAMTDLLIGEIRTEVGTRPRLIIDGSCTMVLEGLKGAYQYEVVTLSDNSSRIKPQPLKNAHSDPMDAAQQGAQMVWKILEGKSGGKVHRRRG